MPCRCGENNHLWRNEIGALAKPIVGRRVVEGGNVALLMRSLGGKGAAPFVPGERRLGLPPIRGQKNISKCAPPDYCIYPKQCCLSIKGKPSDGLDRFMVTEVGNLCVVKWIAVFIADVCLPHYCPPVTVGFIQLCKIDKFDTFCGPLVGQNNLRCSKIKTFNLKHDWAIDSRVSGVAPVLEAKELSAGTCETMTLQDKPNVNAGMATLGGSTWCPIDMKGRVDFKTYLVSQCSSCASNGGDKDCKWYYHHLWEWHIDIDVIRYNWQNSCRLLKSDCGGWRDYTTLHLDGEETGVCKELSLPECKKPNCREIDNTSSNWNEVPVDPALFAELYQRFHLFEASPYRFEIAQPPGRFILLD